jgi:hypothetical protein
VLKLDGHCKNAGWMDIKRLPKMKDCLEAAFLFKVTLYPTRLGYSDAPSLSREGPESSTPKGAL